MLAGNSTFLEDSRRESRKRRRVSERRRVFNRLGVTSPDPNTSALSSVERRDSSYMTTQQQQQQQQRSDSPIGASLRGGNGDQAKISMKIQFHITIAPDDQPLILDHHHQQQPNQPVAPSAEQKKRHFASTESSSIGELIQERLSRQNSSTRRRQQLLAMHQQPALDSLAVSRQQHQQPPQQQQHSDDNLAQFTRRTGSVSGTLNNDDDLVGFKGGGGGREAGLRSSTISGGMQDEATMQFLARHQQRQQQQRLRQASGSLTSTSGSLLGQHQTLMASTNNIRQRQEQREHIYFKRDGQRFGHEFTLKLAVDKSYRCLLKVRPLIPLQAISIQGQHVSFVDCSQTQLGGGGCGSSAASSASSSCVGGSLTLLNQNTSPASGSTRHQSIGNLLGGGSGGSGGQSANGNYKNSHQAFKAALPNQNLPGQPAQRPPENSTTMSEPATSVHHDQNSASLSSLSPNNINGLQHQLLKQQQHNQMMRHFSASHCSTSSSHLGGQLVYMFDWSAGRFEVNKNKARTQVQTVLKFKNGEILSLPLQVKFYQPECRQHLSWGSQLHFIDYDCQINSMGQINVDRIQYY